MATQKKQDTEVTQDAPPVGSAGQESVKGAKFAGEHDSVRGGRPDGPILTSEPPKQADKTSSPVPNDAKPEDPPVRTTRPDVPIAVSLASGAGKHEPPDPELYHPDGRPRLDKDQSK